MEDESTKGKLIQEESSSASTTALGNYTSHCFFLEVFKAFFKCLGFEWRTQVSSSSSPDRKDESSARPQDPSVTTTTTTPQADPPTVTTTEDPAPAGLITVLSAPNRPPVSQGRGPKIN